MGYRIYWLEETITYHYRCVLQCVMSDAAFYHHYDQQSASAYFGFTNPAPVAGFIVLAAY